jgi:type I restriction enzyme, R subunit
MSSFAFLVAEWPDVHEAATRGEVAVRPDPWAACFHARPAVELAVSWMYKHDPELKLPYQANLGALIHEPTFKQVVGGAVFTKVRLIVKLGTQAVHSAVPNKQYDALILVEELFHVGYSRAHTYARGVKGRPRA